jgi:hypothetical protein
MNETHLSISEFASRDNSQKKKKKKEKHDERKITGTSGVRCEPIRNTVTE